VVRYTVRPDRSAADPSTAKLIFTQEQPYSNHNGGQVLFGPDGMLYIPLGDGGAGGDPENRAQNLGTCLGKILRIDVDHGDPYQVPRDNPFVSRRGARPEIWSLGMRNPWRCAFDPPSGLLYVADVGQDRWEEIDVVRANRGGLNYGWRRYEGRHAFRREGRDPAGLVVPLIEYGHGEGCSVTGGVVYRGKRVRALASAYLYSDYCNGWIRSFRVVGGAAVERHEWKLESPGNVSSFGTDSDGEVYVVCLDGAIYRIEPAD
jgi:glucose/arabinose dehydrogenase